MAAVDEQEVKRRKVEGEGEVTEEPKVVEPAKELEQDDQPDKRKKLDGNVCFQLSDSTLNVIPTVGGRVLAPLSDGGLQYLVAGARANTGIKSGRYVFEVKIIELMSPVEPTGGHQRNIPQPRQLLRVGFSTQESPLFLGETEASVCFDSEGCFTADKKRELKGQRINRDQVVALVLNLDKKSPNANTVSLFKDGLRCSEPMPLPEGLQGKPLFPVVNFKNITVQVNFGPLLLAALPFTCRTMQDMAKEDAVVMPSDVPKDGKHEVLFPVGVPDEGTFDWADEFLAKNPQYTELSDRAIMRWAEQSGMRRPPTSSWKNSNDKPDFNFQIPMMDDSSVRRVLTSVISTQPRNYLVMEVKSNLVQAERVEQLKRFSHPQYRKVAQVTMGEPTSEFKQKVQETMLKEKQEQAEKEWRNRKAENEKRKLFRKQQKELEEAKKRAEEELKKKAAELMKAAEDQSKAAEGGEEVKQEEEKADIEMKAESTDGVKEEAKEEAKDGVKEEPEDGAVKAEAVKEEKDEEKKDEEEEEKEEPCPVAELTAEEKAMWFKKKATTDLTNWVLGQQFPRFSIPNDEDGFDEIRFTWQGKEKCNEYFKAWILKQKILCRIEELQPGEWFRTKWTEWQKALAEWHQKQVDFKDPIKEMTRRQAEEDAKAKADEEKRANEAAAAEGMPSEGEKKEGEDGEKKEAADEKPAEEANTPEQKKDEEGADDIFTVENVCDTGNGEPLFSKFTFEDWALLSLRLELYLLVQAFKKDVRDPERVGIHESHLAFYYNKYYRKSFNVKYYGIDTNTELVNMVKDAVTVNQENGVLVTTLSDEVNFDMFIRLTEDGRRDRQRRIDAGDESAKLKINKPPEAPAPYQGGAHSGGYSGYKGAKVGGYGPQRGATVPPPAGSYHGYGGAKGGPYAGKGAVVGGGDFGKGYGGHGKSVCKQWQAGNCRYGAQCRFAHPQ